MSEWITDRKPYAMGEHTVFNQFGEIVDGVTIKQGEPWKPIPKCEPYVKPKRFRVKEVTLRGGRYAVFDDEGSCCSLYLPTHESAERIAAIYEEMYP